MKNANKKRKNDEKQKKCGVFSCPKDHSTQKIRFIGHKVCTVACV